MKEHKMSRRNFLKVGAVASAAGLMTAAPVAANAAAPAASTAADEENCFGLFQKKPKYIFLFIGDGMGTAQIQSARFYQGTVTNNGAITEAELSFTQFPEVGSVTTYDSTSFCPDSASTATSIASGKKTESGVINMCPWTRDVPYETIAEKLHKQKGYKVGIVSTVNIDHATPAAFYAHQKTRKNYYQIGVELANSGFEYFAGGEFQKVNGDGTDPNNHEVAAQAGYNVVTTQAGAAALKAGAGKTLIIAENLADGKSMNYAMDAAPGEWQLTDYEVENLRTAYERTLKVGSSSQSKMSQQDYELYGTYIPFSMAICHTINHKSGVDHTTYAHTGAMVNLYARGQGADKFRGVYDNTEIFHKLAELTDVQ